MMTGLTTLNSASALIGNSARQAVASRATAADLTSLASGVASRARGSDESGISSSIYSVNHVDANKLKIDLMERIGKAFGLEFDDFKDSVALARAIRPAFQRMEQAQVTAMEKSLGLDKLGVSLRTVLDAMENPGGDSDKKLEGALLETAGKTLDSAKGVGLDDIGRYSRESLR